MQAFSASWQTFTSIGTGFKHPCGRLDNPPSNIRNAGSRISPVDSMGQCNTGSKSANRSFKSYIRPRALMQTENTVLFKFN